MPSVDEHHSLLFTPITHAVRLLGVARLTQLLGLVVSLYFITLAYLVLHPTLIGHVDLILFTALGIGLVLYFLAGIGHYVRRTSQSLIVAGQGIEQGDYHQIAAHNGNDELSRAWNQLVQTDRAVNRLVTRIQQNAVEALSAARSERRIVELSAQNAEQQRAAMSEIAAATEQLSASIHHLDEQVRNTEQTTRLTQHHCNEGHHQLQATIDHIETISAMVKQAVDRIQTLEQQSQEVGKIMDVITGIAEQTNLLALNAAIEAARAGEHGRGFAVVSDEVRQLAIRTHGATDEVARIVSATQQETQAVIGEINTIDQSMDETIQLNRQAGESLQAIINAADQAAAHTETTSATVTQQTHVCNDVAANTQRVHDMADAHRRDAIEAKETAVYMETLSLRVLNALPGQCERDNDA